MRADRLSWLEWRRQGVGASDVAAILSLSPWGSPLSVYLNKTGQTPLDGDESEPMRWGKLLEQAIVDEFAERTGLRVVAEQSQCVHDLFAHHRATVDGFVTDSPLPDNPDDDLAWEPLGLLEVKVAGVTAWDEPPVHYQIQCQWQMHVTDLDRVWLAALHGGRRMVIYELKRDPGLISELVAAVDEFWQRVEDRRPPAADAHDATRRALAEAYPETSGEAVELPEDLAIAADTLKQLKAEKKELEAHVAELENRLKLFLGDAEAGLVDGWPAVIWREITARRWDTKALEQDLPELADRYKRPSTYRRFELKGGT